MKRLLLSILAAIALPTAVNAEKFDITCFWKMENVNRSGQAIERFIIDTELDNLKKFSKKRFKAINKFLTKYEKKHYLKSLNRINLTKNKIINIKNKIF